MVHEGELKHKFREKRAMFWRGDQLHTGPSKQSVWYQNKYNINGINPTHNIHVSIYQLHH